MAKASIKLTGSASWEGRGRKWKRKGEVKIITDEDDIAFFKANGNFTVKDIVDKPATKVAGKGKGKAKPKSTPKPPDPPSGEGNGEDEGDGDGPSSWKKNSNKAVLTEACESRGIAFTGEETNGDMVVLLEDWDANQ